MKQFNMMKKILLMISIFSFQLLIGISMTNAQGLSGSVSFDILPYQDFKDPITLEDNSVINDAQAQLSKTKATLAYPFIFSQGRTILVNEVTYQLIEFDYRNLTTDLKKLHSGSYTLMLQHQMSEKWSLWAIATPALASDLEAEVSSSDFNFQAATIFIRKYSEKFSLGLGAAYSTQFGSAVPLPIIAFDWNNGSNLMIKGILPVNLEMWYRASKRVDLGLLLSGDGDNYSGDPAIYDVSNPELRYTMLTFGPAAKITVAKKLVINIEAGIVGLHQFEFYDGDHEEFSYELEPSQYVRFGLSFGN